MARAGTGILDLATLAVTLAFAIPIAHFGLTTLLAGDPLGAAFLLVAAALVVLQHALTTPEDVPIRAVQRLASRLVGGKRD